MKLNPEELKSLKEHENRIKEMERVLLSYKDQIKKLTDPERSSLQDDISKALRDFYNHSYLPIRAYDASNVIIAVPVNHPDTTRFNAFTSQYGCHRVICMDGVEVTILLAY